MSTYQIGKKKYKAYFHEAWAPGMIGILAVLAKTHPDELREVFGALDFKLNDSSGNAVTLEEFIDDFKEKE